MRGFEGTAKVKVTVDSQGRLVASELLQTTGYSSLDKAALDAVEKAAPYPVPPDGLNGPDLEFIYPINFMRETLSKSQEGCK
jgi:protein TonB